MESDEINLQPDFQRNEVWGLPKKRKLIDTIMRDWTIPPVHLIEQGNGTLEVLDGQQRLSAIMAFYDDEIAIDGNISPRDVVVSALHELRYSELPIDSRRRFDRFTLRIVTIYDFQPDEPGELFYRLNEGVKLSPAEQRNALFGPIREQVKSLVDTFSQFGLDKTAIGFSNSRMAYEDVIARCLFALERGSIYSSFSDAEISNRFRLANEVDASSFNQIRSAIVLLGHNVSNAGFAKLNKSTLFSLLIFLCFSNEYFVDHKTQFELSMLGQKDWKDFIIYVSGQSSQVSSMNKDRELFTRQELAYGSIPSILYVIHNTYRDRSSLRVNDAASVVSRDICLWLYVYITRGITPHTQLRERICEYLIREHDRGGEDGFSSALFDKSLLSDWGSF